jgi:biopolymer transport protein TolR
MAEINVVPYIDVMLVLLIIFMVTTPLLSQGVKVNLPQASAQTIPPKEQEPLIVSVDAQGNYYLNVSSTPNQPIDTTALAMQVANELQTSQQKGQSRPVLVKGDRDVNYGKVMQAMVVLQQAGAPSVGLVTESPTSDTQKK